jgi:WD40 repeat protein
LVALGGVFTSGEPLLIVYDTVTRQVVHKFSSLTGRVYGVCASRDGRHLFSAADNVHGWSLQTESDKPIFEFADHNDNVFSVDESPDGTLLATAGTDGTVRVFQWHQLLQ